jgi:hypothetical protein
MNNGKVSARDLCVRSAALILILLDASNLSAILLISVRYRLN